MSDNQEIKFSIQGIIVSKLSIELKDDLIKIVRETQQPFSNYTFEINCRNQGFITSNLINIFVAVKIFLDKEEKIELGFIQVENIYQVENLRNLYDKSNNKLNLPTQFEAALISISLSHTRAMIITKFAGTFLENALLPLMSPMNFLNKLEKKEKLEGEEKSKLKEEINS